MKFIKKFIYNIIFLIIVSSIMYLITNTTNHLSALEILSIIININIFASLAIVLIYLWNNRKANSEKEKYENIKNNGWILSIMIISSIGFAISSVVQRTINLNIVFFIIYFIMFVILSTRYYKIINTEKVNVKSTLNNFSKRIQDLWMLNYLFVSLYGIIMILEVGFKDKFSASGYLINLTTVVITIYAIDFIIQEHNWRRNKFKRTSMYTQIHELNNYMHLKFAKFLDNENLDLHKVPEEEIIKIIKESNFWNKMIKFQFESINRKKYIIIIISNIKDELNSFITTYNDILSIDRNDERQIIQEDIKEIFGALNHILLYTDEVVKEKNSNSIAILLHSLVENMYKLTSDLEQYIK